MIKLLLKKMRGKSFFIFIILVILMIVINSLYTCKLLFVSKIFPVACDNLRHNDYISRYFGLPATYGAYLSTLDYV